MSEQGMALLTELNARRATHARLLDLADRWERRSAGDMWAQDKFFAVELRMILEGNQ